MGTPKKKKKFACIIFSPMTFSQQPKGLKTVFYVFFKSLKSKKLILRVNLSEFGVSEGPTFFRLKNDPKNTWNMFIGSIRNPMQKFGDGLFFFYLAPFASLDTRPSGHCLALIDNYRMLLPVYLVFYGWGRRPACDGVVLTTRRSRRRHPPQRPTVVLSLFLSLFRNLNKKHKIGVWWKSIMKNRVMNKNECSIVTVLWLMKI